MSGSAGPAGMDESDDFIEDDYDSYDELFTHHFADEQNSGLDSPGAVLNIQARPSAKSPQKPVGNTKRFLAQSDTVSRPQQSRRLAPTEEETLPWAQKYRPRNLEELAVHKRKVRDVEQWLNEAFARRTRRVCQGYAPLAFINSKAAFSSLLIYYQLLTTAESARPQGPSGERENHNAIIIVRQIEIQHSRMENSLYLRLCREWPRSPWG